MLENKLAATSAIDNFILGVSSVRISKRDSQIIKQRGAMEVPEKTVAWRRQRTTADANCSSGTAYGAKNIVRRSQHADWRAAELKHELNAAIDCRFDASAERVFDAWIDPRTAVKWLFTTITSEWHQAQMNARWWSMADCRSSCGNALP